MRKVIMIGEEPKEESKGVEFTHYYHNTEGWVENILIPSDFNKIAYLGKCDTDGDMFAAYFEEQNTITIYKGNLNNGTY
jgi:hypothetical protein